MDSNTDRLKEQTLNQIKKQMSRDELMNILDPTKERLKLVQEKTQATLSSIT